MDSQSLDNRLSQTEKYRQFNTDQSDANLDNITVLAQLLVVRVGLAQVCGELLQGVPDGHHHGHRVGLEDD